MPVREVALDTETTGLSDKTDRIVEIACVELIDQIPTGRVYHQYINPERSIPADASRIHNVFDADVADKPIFRDVVGDFLDFIGGDDLVIHNASFDMKMLNAELARINRPRLPNQTIDTLAIARKKFPGSRATLDALLARFEIDASSRTFHGAMIDTQLLCKVYVCLLGKHMLIPDELPDADSVVIRDSDLMPLSARHMTFARRPIQLPSAQEAAAHTQFVGRIKDSLWTSILSERIA